MRSRCARSFVDIARRAVITKGAIYYHFANRDELIEAVFVVYAIGDRITDEEGRPRLVHDRNLQEAAIAQIVDILRRGQEAGEFGDFDPRSMAMMIRATIEAMPTYTLAYPDLDIDAYGRDLVTFFERAVGADKRPAKPRSKGK